MLKRLPAARNLAPNEPTPRLPETMQGTDLPPISEDPAPGSEKLFLFFGGIAGAIGMPQFEFYRASRILQYSKIFLRDPHQWWYLRGLPSVGHDAHAIGDYLRRKILESGALEVYFVGNSMGAFAALLFCAMLRQGKAIAFAPRTFVSQENRHLHGDHRWPQQIEALHKARPAPTLCDLRIWIRESFPEINADVYISSSDALAMRHANELIDFPNIEIHCVPDAGHRLVAKLRGDGLLARLLAT